MAEHPALARRAVIGVVAGLALPIAACSPPSPAPPTDPREVGAVEDLMREHGVLRRVLRIYDQLSGRLLMGDAGFDAAALGQAAQLFRDFGEDYHERMLEEAYLFPRLRQAGGRAGALVDVLRDQHERGRDITEYLLAACKSGKIRDADAAPLGRTLRAMAVMYENHAAREDTVVFPAWKAALSASELKETGDKFEDIEKKVFGPDGFEQGEAKISQIEQSLGFADLAQFSAAAPPSTAG